MITWEYMYIGCYIRKLQGLSVHLGSDLIRPTHKSWIHAT